jgi:hypothetical protein
MDDNFEISLSEKVGYWLVKDYEYNIQVEFEHGKFNETQQVLNIDTLNPSDFMHLDRRMGEIAEWLRANHYDKVFSSEINLN